MIICTLTGDTQLVSADQAQALITYRAGEQFTFIAGQWSCAVLRDSNGRSVVAPKACFEALFDWKIVGGKNET